MFTVSINVVYCMLFLAADAIQGEIDCIPELVFLKNCSSIT
jgi:hypothetical protein